MIMQIPGPGTAPTDWLPDYQPPAPYTYRPRTPRPGTPARRTKTGRPMGGKHPEKRRAQWRLAKQRAKARREIETEILRNKP
jgi:hypothetical protein